MEEAALYFLPRDTANVSDFVFIQLCVYLQGCVFNTCSKFHHVYLIRIFVERTFLRVSYAWVIPIPIIHGLPYHKKYISL